MPMKARTPVSNCWPVASSAMCRIIFRSSVSASMSSARHNAQGELETFSEATVRVNIDGESLISAAEGNGPVHALYVALSKDLGKYQRHIEDIELLDFRVRVFQGGADAVTRVLVEFGDKQGETWSTVGVSPNLIDASFQALLDAVDYKLLKSGA